MAEKTDICNFADIATSHAYDSSLDFLVKRLEHDVNLAIEWFDDNCRKLNQYKCHLMNSGHDFEAVWAKIRQHTNLRMYRAKITGSCHRD